MSNMARDLYVYTSTQAIDDLHHHKHSIIKFYSKNLYSTSHKLPHIDLELVWRGDLFLTILEAGVTLGLSSSVNRLS